MLTPCGKNRLRKIIVRLSVLLIGGGFPIVLAWGQQPPVPRGVSRAADEETAPPVPVAPPVAEAPPLPGTFVPPEPVLPPDELAPPDPLFSLPPAPAPGAPPLEVMPPLPPPSVPPLAQPNPAAEMATATRIDFKGAKRSGI